MERYIDVAGLLDRSSFFLFGPRGTGKSWLMRAVEGDVDYIDLLGSRVYLDLHRDPSRLEEYVRHKRVIIDEVQRIPEILNEVQRLIEERGIRFALTGSSARKLKRSGTNLLAGRAYRSNLYGLTWREITTDDTAGQFDLDRYLLYGGQPMAWLGDDPEEYLYAYTDTYLREEIQAEALVRNLSNYGRFLEMAAHCNAEMINYTKVGNDAQVHPNTIRDYYQLLEDTLIGSTLPPWTKSTKRKAIQTPRFYFFDIGVANSIRNIRTLDRNSDLYGKAFEHFIYSEIRSYLSYNRIRLPLTFWRSKNQQEVDFVVGDETAIEVKASKRVSQRDHKGLGAISEEADFRHLLLVSADKTSKTFTSGIRHQYWENFLKDLWGGKYF